MGAGRRAKGGRRRGRLATASALGAVLVLAVGCGGGKDAPPTPTPTPSVSPTATPSPSATPTPSATPATFAGTYKDVSSGVVRVDVATCEEEGHGTGFLVAPDLVATVAHVVQDAAVVRVTAGTVATAGTVIGLDAGTDMALVQVARPLAGHVFTLRPTPPQVGESVGVIGFPEDQPLTLTQGAVTGLDRKAVIDGISRHSLVQTDAAVNPGNSGGPAIDVDGQVIGLADAVTIGAQNTNFLVANRTARTFTDTWRTAPAPPTVAVCTPTTPTEADDLPGGAAFGVESTIGFYFDRINVGDFPTAFAQLDPATSGLDLESFTDGVRSSQDTDVQILSITPDGADLVAWVTFTSQQDPAQGPRPGETCDRWSLDYRMHQVGGLWLIAHTGPHAGTPTSEAC